MNLTKFDQKYVRLKDIYGETYIGMAVHHSADYCYHEYAVDEEALQIGDCIIYASQIAGIEEVTPHGSAELWTERMVLRRYRPDDAESLYRYFGSDPAMVKYSGWNPYATLEMAEETVQRFIRSYEDEHTYSWVMDFEDVLIGTIGAYDYIPEQIEVGFSVQPDWQGRGYATEALQKVLEYLTKNEGIPCVTAWCAAENEGSRRVLEKAGMQLVRCEKNGLAIGDQTYDKLCWEYRWEN